MSALLTVRCARVQRERHIENTSDGLAHNALALVHSATSAFGHLQGVGMSFANLSFAALPFHEQAVLILLILISVGSLGVLLYNGFLQAQERLSESLRRRAKREAYSMGH